MREQLRRYRVAVAIGFVGLLTVIITGLVFESGAAVMWSGGIVGVVTGIAIAATQKDDDPRKR